MQYVNQQYWNTKDGGIGTKETGRQLNLSYMVPISGSELENFNTMIGTGEYPEIVDLAYSIESPHALYENGVLMDITEYVERYMPNYMAFLDANPVPAITRFIRSLTARRIPGRGRATAATWS